METSVCEKTFANRSLKVCGIFESDVVVANLLNSVLHVL